MLTRFMMLKVVSGFSARAASIFCRSVCIFNSLFGSTIVDRRLTIRLVSANGKKGFPLGGVRVCHAVTFYFVNPQWAGRWAGCLRRQARSDEAGGTPRDHQRSAKYKTAQATMITVTIKVLVFVKALSRSASFAAIAAEAASILGVLGLVVFATAPSWSAPISRY